MTDILINWSYLQTLIILIFNDGKTELSTKYYTDVLYCGFTQDAVFYLHSVQEKGLVCHPEIKGTWPAWMEDGHLWTLVYNRDSFNWGVFSPQLFLVCINA